MQLIPHINEIGDLIVLADEPEQESETERLSRAIAANPRATKVELRLQPASAAIGLARSPPPQGGTTTSALDGREANDRQNETGTIAPVNGPDRPSRPADAAGIGRAAQGQDQLGFKTTQTRAKVRANKTPLPCIPLGRSFDFIGRLCVNGCSRIKSDPNLLVWYN